MGSSASSSSQSSSETIYEFTFTEDEPSTDEVLRLLSMAKWLKSLELDRRNDTDAILGCVKISNQRLETLNLWNCEGSPSKKPVSSVSLLGVLDHCNLLQHLSLEGSYCEGREVYNEIGLRLPSLRFVHLGKSTRYDPQALLNIADNCRNIEEIQAIDFDTYTWENNHSITDHIVFFLCNQSIYFKILEIDFQNCTDASMIIISMCQQLATLTLHVAAKITNMGIMAISDMPQLVKLTVYDNHQISTHGWLAFLQQPIMRRLQELRLYNCVNVNHDAMNMILNNPYKLREIRIGNDEVNCYWDFNPEIIN